MTPLLRKMRSIKKQHTLKKLVSGGTAKNVPGTFIIDAVDIFPSRAHEGAGLLCPTDRHRLIGGAVIQLDRRADIAKVVDRRDERHHTWQRVQLILELRFQRD